MHAIADRIAFRPETETMAVDFSGLDFETAGMVDAVYDEIERLIAASGDDRWYFLVNLSGARIQPGAWMRYTQRGRLLNERHSLGSVRFDASDETRREIEARADSEAFDANLFADRPAAEARIEELRAAAPRRFKPKPRPKSEWGADEFARRTTLHQALSVMEADFSNFTFATLGDVHDFYDHLDHTMRVTGRKWFFLVNLQNTRIMPEVWGAYAARGKKLNHDFSLGSVRFDASEETAAEIRRRANTEAFDPNLCPGREAALARIEEMRAEAGKVAEAG